MGNQKEVSDDLIMWETWPMRIEGCQDNGINEIVMFYKERFSEISIFYLGFISLSLNVFCDDLLRSLGFLSFSTSKTLAMGIILKPK